MKVLLVVHGFPPSAQGGSEIYAESHARTLSDRYGDEVLVVTRESDPAAAEYRVRTESRAEFRIAWINNTFRATRSYAETYENPAIGSIAARLIDEFQPDVAHIHHLTCLSTAIVEALSRRGTPCNLTLHDYWLLCHRGQLLDRDLRVCPGPEPDGCAVCLDEAATVGRLGFAAAGALRTAGRWLPPVLPLLRGVRRGAGRVVPATTSATSEALASEAGRRLAHMQRITERITHFLAPSNHFRERFIEFGVSPDRITCSRYGFDHRPFETLPGPADQPTANRLRIGFLGSLMVSKAPHLLLEAYRGLPPGTASVDLFGAHVDYHGDDSYRGELASLLAQDGVRLHGSLPHEEVGSAFAALDVLVVPSVWPENSPLVIHEAFLAGVPVVASRIGGIPEVVSDQVNGLLFRPGDVEDLRGALTRLVSEPGLLSSLRDGIPSVRTIEDDVDESRRLYAAQIARTSDDTTERVAAVVLNYNTPDETVLSVRSLLASRRAIDDVIVVDNHPSNGCRQALGPLRDLGHMTYLKTGRNLGFSGGMNVGIRHALERGAAHVMLVNSDVFVPPDCLEQLERALADRPNVGIVGPVVRIRSHPDRVASLGMSYVPWSGRMCHQGFGTTLDAPTGEGPAPDRPIDAVSGCLMLVTREVFEKVGLLDEDYFFSFEDLDLCLRARHSGFASVLVGAASVYHEGARSVGPDSLDRLYYAARNHQLLAHRTAPGTNRLQAVGRGLSILGLNVAYGIKFRGGSLASRLAAVAQGTGDFLRGRFGPR